MKPVLRGFNRRKLVTIKEEKWGLSRLISVPVSHFLWITFFSLCPRVFMSQLSTLACFSPPEINRGVESWQRLLRWTQMFQVVRYCQQSADLFLSSHSSMRQVSNPRSVICAAVMSFSSSLFSLFSLGKHNRPFLLCGQMRP